MTVVYSAVLTDAPKVGHSAERRALTRAAAKAVRWAASTAPRMAVQMASTKAEQRADTMVGSMAAWRGCRWADLWAWTMVERRAARSAEKLAEW